MYVFVSKRERIKGRAKVWESPRECVRMGGPEGFGKREPMRLPKSLFECACVCVCVHEVFY